MRITHYPPCKSTLPTSYREMKQQVVFLSYTQLHQNMYINTCNAWKSLSIYRCNILQTAHFPQQMAITAFPAAQKWFSKRSCFLLLIQRWAHEEQRGRTSHSPFSSCICNATRRYTYYKLAQGFLAVWEKLHWSTTQECSWGHAEPKTGTEL